MIKKFALGLSIFIGLLIIVFLFSKETSLKADLKDKHVIDWHAHVAGLGYGNTANFINKEMRDNYRFGFFIRWMQVTEDELKVHGDQLVVKRLNHRISESEYVDQAIVLAMDGIINSETGELDKEKTQFYVDNDYIAKETAKYSTLLFGASINPNRPDSIKRLEKAHEQGAVLVKWLPSIMYIDPADEKHIPFYKRLVELNIPLLTHTGMEKSFPSAKDELADPRRLELPLKHGVTVIAAHIATTGESEGQDNFERILPMFDEYPNLYVDISSLTQVNKLGYLAKAVKYPGLMERMVYGTDWPLQSFPLVSPWYHINHINMKDVKRISRIKNQWDRDIELKRLFGVTDEVMYRKLGLLAQ